MATGEQSSPRTCLAFSLAAVLTIDWLSKDGYFLTSTADLIAAASDSIQLDKLDVGFLGFGRSSLAQRFIDLVQELRRQLLRDGILSFRLINRIGEELMDPDGNRSILVPNSGSRSIGI